MTDVEEEIADYNGPLPDGDLRIMPVNTGKVAASEITGWLYFRAEHLEPLPFFSGFAEKTYILGSDDTSDEIRIKVGGNKDDTLFPSAPGGLAKDYLSFDLSLSIKADQLPITTLVRYEFVTPTGYSAQGEHLLEMRPDLKRPPSL